MWAGVQAVLAYRVPLAGSLDRPQRKILHAALHSAALLCIVLALVAAFQSHNLKRPTPTPNLYSPHSYLGLAVTILAFLQARSAPPPCAALPCSALPLYRDPWTLSPSQYLVVFMDSVSSWVRPS